MFQFIFIQVLMYVNLTCDEKERQNLIKELKKLKYLADKYKSDGFGVYGVFTYDVQGGDDMTNQQIADLLTEMGVKINTTITSSQQQQ